MIAMQSGISVATLSIILGCTVLSAPQEEPNDSQSLRNVDYMVPGIVNGLQAESRVYRLPRGIERLKAEPVYLQLSYAPYVIETLASDQRVETLDYEWDPGTNDLRYVAARGAWVLESVFGIKVAPINASTVKADRDQATRLAQVQFDAYRAGIMRTVEQYAIGRDIEELAQKYQAKIQEGTEEHPSHGFFKPAGPHLKRMLREFFPLGRKLSDLEYVIGRKAFAYEPDLRERDTSEGVTGVFEYRYSDGMFGRAYFFLVRDGIIEAVSWQPL